MGRGVLGGIPPETRRRTPEIPFSRDFAFPNDRCHHSFGISNQVEIPRKTPQEDSTNIFGTVNVADAARSCNVSTCIQISTDKAVNPTSVMGVSKRVAEQYCQALEL